MQPTKEELLERLLDAAHEATQGWCFFPADDYGSTEALASSEALAKLERALEDYLDARDAR